MRPLLVSALWTSALAVVCTGQTELPRERAILVKIRQRMQENLRNTPNYTCLETFSRANRPPLSLAISRNGGPSRFLQYDMVRLEVAAVDGKEFFALPGARSFRETEMRTFVAEGMIGNGLFTLFAKDIFDPAIAAYRFAGEQNLAGKPLLRYDFDVSILLSGYRIKTQFGEARVAYSGSFWADPGTFDVILLHVVPIDIPRYLGVANATTDIDYGKIRIGTQDIMLPQGAVMTMDEFTGWKRHNQIAFTHCKAYSASSVISFEAPSIEPSTAPLPASQDYELPSGLLLATRLETALDSATARLGDLVHATVETDVKHKGAVVIPKGTMVTGRIRRLDQYLEPARYFIIGLEFFRFDFPGNPRRFFATIEKIGAAPPAGHITIVRLPELPGVATFSIRGDTVHLPPGTRMVWRTAGYDLTGAGR